MNLANFDNFSLNEKIRSQARSINLDTEKLSPSKNSSFSNHMSIRKPIKTLPDTPEQFLRSGSQTNKSKNSFNCYTKNFSIFESPKTVSSFTESIDHSLELKKLENLLKSKERRLSEQELLLKIEREEFLREKDQLFSKHHCKKARLAQAKQEMKEEREYLNRKINELDLKFIEVKEMIIAYEANKETIKNNLRTELLKDLNKQKVDFCQDERLKKRSNHQSFGEDFSEKEVKKITQLKQVLTEQETLMTRKEEAFELKLEEIRKLEKTYLDKLEVLQNKETISDNYQEVIENLQSELKFFREKCSKLEKELTKNKSLSLDEDSLKEEEIQAKIKQISAQQSQLTNQSLEVSKEVQRLTVKEQELEKLSQSLNKKSEDLKQQEKKLNEKAEELEKAADLLKTLNEELESQKKSQESEQEQIQAALLKLKKIAEKQEERENLIKAKEEKFKF